MWNHSHECTYMYDYSKQIPMSGTNTNSLNEKEREEEA
jgi:hypothetical protein